MFFIYSNAISDLKLKKKTTDLDDVEIRFGRCWDESVAPVAGDEGLDHFRTEKIRRKSVPREDGDSGLIFHVDGKTAPSPLLLSATSPTAGRWRNVVVHDGG